MTPIKLTEIKEPRFQIELPDGTVREYDPWEMTAKLADAEKASVDIEQSFDLTRSAFGFPVAADVAAAKASGAPVPFTLTRHQTVAVKAALGEFLKELDVSKKLSALSPA